MKLLFFTLTFLFTSTHISVNDYVGNWTYSINTPDGAIGGVMVLEYDDGTYNGTITAYGQTYDMIDIEVDGNKMNFKTNAAGYSSVIKGSFDADIYTAIISVEGMEIPMKAKKE